MASTPEIVVKRPKAEDIVSIKVLLEITINNTFVAEQISGDNQAKIEREIENHLKALQRDLASNGKDECFLIARNESEIVGIIAFGKPNRIILANLDFDSESKPEIKCAYVHPDFQRQGIGGMLFDKIMYELHRRGTTHFCLDSGYKRAQKFWANRLGPPSVILPDYFGPGAHHMIWLCEVSHYV